MDICLYNNGDIGELINLAQPLSYLALLTSMETQLQELNISYSLEDFESIQNNEINIQTSLQYSNVAAPNTNPNDTPDNSLTKFNQLTNKKATGSHQDTCKINFTEDLWVFLQESCKKGYKLIEPQKPLANLGSPSCMIINDWTNNQITTRYSGYLTCTYVSSIGNYIQTIQAYHNSLLAFQNSVNSLFGEINIALEAISGNINQTVSNIVNQNQKIYDYFNDEDQLGIIVQDGHRLTNQLDCSFVYSYSNTLKKTMCVNSRESIYQVFVYLFVLSFLLIMLEVINAYLSKSLLKKVEESGTELLVLK